VEEGGERMKKMYYILAGFLLLSGCTVHGGSSASSGSWVTSNLINFHNISYVGTDEKVEQVESKIGSIALSSTKEQDSNSENFSNFYPKGTNLYKISHVPIKEAIAIEVKKHHYIKAVPFKLK
jgi:hypothetical protein